MSSMVKQIASNSVIWRLLQINMIILTKQRDITYDGYMLHFDFFTGFECISRRYCGLSPLKLSRFCIWFMLVL